MVQNYMEILVDNALNDELKSYPEKYTDVCQCPSCLAYIKAVALNNLKPFYVTTVAGGVFGQFQSKDSQNLTDVMAAIGRGIDALSKLSPHGNTL